MISGFRASNIGQYGIEDFSWTQGGRIGSPSFDTYAPSGRFGAPGYGTQSPFFDNPILDALGQSVVAWAGEILKPERTSVPVVRSAPTPIQAKLPVVPDPLPEAVVPQAWTPPDPEARPEFVVYEDAPGGIYEVERAETDWDVVYEQYVELNAPKPVEGEMWEWLQGATTIGQIGSEVGWWGGSDTDVMRARGGDGGPAPIPAKVTVDTRTGKVTTCKRRRRRKLLTESDFNVLLRVATLPNKENVRIVLGKAIGRS